MLPFCSTFELRYPYATRQGTELKVQGEVARAGFANLIF